MLVNLIFIANSDNTFTYDLDRYPEEPSYTSSSTTILSYDTTSKTAYGTYSSRFHYLKKEKDILDYLVFLL